MARSPSQHATCPRRLGIRSFTRWAEGMEDETDALLCLCQHFAERHIRKPDLWQNAVLPEVTKFLRQNAVAGGHYLLNLQTLTSVAFLAGYLLEPKLGAHVDILQSPLGPPWDVHPSAVRTVPDGWAVGEQIQAKGDELAVGFSVSQDVSGDVLEYVHSATLPAKATVIFSLPGGASQTALSSGTEAFALAQHAVNKVRQLRRAHGVRGTTHLFIAAPKAFSFFLGQLARPLGAVRLYEYAYEDGRLGAYTPSLDLSSSLRL